MAETDDVIEEIVEDDEESQGPAAIKKLREKLAAAVKEKQEYLEGWQRARADFANFKKEEAQMVGEREDRVKAEIAESIISALDAFEMAIKSPSFQTVDAQWQKGMTGVYQQLVQSLGKNGIVQTGGFGKEKELVGRPFDPAQHEAVREVPVETLELDHTVVSVERSGYSIGERIIRPAQVSVGAFTK